MLLLAGCVVGTIDGATGTESGDVRSPAAFVGHWMLDGESTAADLAEFCTTYDRIDGSLSLGETDFTSLDGLECLTSVTGTVRIERNPGLLSIGALEGLTEISDYLVIEDNESLDLTETPAALASVGGLYLSRLPATETLGAWASLTTVEQNVELLDLPVLDGLDGITAVGGDIAIRRSTATTFSALSSVQTAGSLAFADNVALSKLAGLTSLAAVSGIVSLSDPKLEDLSGLNTLSDVGRLHLLYVATENLDAFSSLRRVGGDLELIYNPALRDLQGLGGVERIEGALRVVGNSSLNPSEVTTLVEAIGAENILGGVVTDGSCVAPCE